MESSLSSCGHACTNLGIPIPGEEEEKEELENLLKWGKFSFYVTVDREIFTCLKNKKYVILIVQDFQFLIGTIHHVRVNGAIWSNSLTL